MPTSTTFWALALILVLATLAALVAPLMRSRARRQGPGDEDSAAAIYRELMERNPHQIIEGALIAAYAVNARMVFNYIRGEYMDASYAFEDALRVAEKEAACSA